MKKKVAITHTRARDYAAHRHWTGYCSLPSGMIDQAKDNPAAPIAPPNNRASKPRHHQKLMKTFMIPVDKYRVKQHLPKRWQCAGVPTVYQSGHDFKSGK